MYKSDVHSLVTSITLSLSETSIRNCCFRRHHHLVVDFFFFSFVMLLSLSLRLLVRYRFFFHFSTYIYLNLTPKLNKNFITYNCGNVKVYVK